VLHQSIEKGLLGIGLDVIRFKIDINDYKNYLKQANYYQYDYANWIKNTFAEKTLEHYLAATLLNLNEHDVYIDIANAGSPTPEIYQKIFKCSRVYRQDLIFPPGFNGDKIGSDASRLPLPNDFCTAMALHCSFEHFEGDSDIGFIRETSRVLRPGGRLCILPLYIAAQHTIQVDPALLPPEGLDIDDGANILLKTDGYDTRHARFYNVQNLEKRIKNNLNSLKMKIYFIENEKEVDQNCYVKFAALFEKDHDKPHQA
jgi:SAM-dependent methyltransferase